MDVTSLLLFTTAAVFPATPTEPPKPLLRLASTTTPTLHATGKATAFWVTSTGTSPLEAGTFDLALDHEKGALRIALPVIGNVTWACDESQAWEIDPLFGPIVHAGARGAGVRRLLTAISGGTHWQNVYSNSALQDRAATTSTYAMSPSLAETDLWTLDPTSPRLLSAQVAIPTGHIRSGLGQTDVDSQGGKSDIVVIARSSFDASDSIPREITITRDHYRYVLAIDSVSTDEIVGNPFRINDHQLAEAQRVSAYSEGSPEMEITQLTEVHVVSIRKQAKVADLGGEFAMLLPEVMRFLQSEGVQPIGAPFARYHSFTGSDTDVEVGFPVAKPLKGNDRVKPRTLPAGRAVSTWHIGPYHTLSESYGRLEGWIGEQKLTSRGPGWEIYWTDPGLEPDPAKWRTQLLRPIE